MGLSERGVWGVPTGTPIPRASRRAASRRCCCWRSMSAISRGRELKLALSCSSLDSKPLICFSRSSLRSFSSVMRSYITFCIWGGDTGDSGRVSTMAGGVSATAASRDHPFIPFCPESCPISAHPRFSKGSVTAAHPWPSKQGNSAGPVLLSSGIPCKKGCREPLAHVCVSPLALQGQPSHSSYSLLTFIELEHFAVSQVCFSFSK